MYKVLLNTDDEGCAKTIVAGYYKFGCANLLGDTFGTSGTIVLEIDYGKEKERD